MPERISGKRIWRLSNGDRIALQAVFSVLIIVFLAYDVIHHRSVRAAIDVAVLAFSLWEIRRLIRR